MKHEKISPLLQLKLTQILIVLLHEKQIIFLTIIQLLSLKDTNLESKVKTSCKYSLFQSTGLISTCRSSFIHFFFLFSKTMTNFDLAFYLGAKDGGKKILLTRYIWTKMKGTVWNNLYVQGKSNLLLLCLPDYISSKLMWTTSLYALMINLSGGKWSSTWRTLRMSFIQCLPPELPEENVNKLSYFLRLPSKTNYIFYITRINASLATPNIFGLLSFNYTPVQFYFSIIHHLFTPFSAAK